MSGGPHLLIPFAGSHSAGARQAMPGLVLPHLAKLLARMTVAGTDEGSERSLSMPHERALAHAYGVEADDGLVPLAAWHAAQSGRTAGTTAWAFITPCHWRVATDHVAMADPRDLQLDEPQSRALLAAMQPFFEQDGIALDYGAPMQWLARGELFRTLPTASLDRVVGRTVDAWMPRSAAAGPLRRLQQEMQMLLYTHPVNDERAQAGLPPVNSFWVSGTGALAAAHEAAAHSELHVPQALRDAAVRADWAAWADGWRSLDEAAVAPLAARVANGEPVRITLCGERHARTWSMQRSGLWDRLKAVVARTPVAQVLEAL